MLNAKCLCFFFQTQFRKRKWKTTEVSWYLIIGPSCAKMFKPSYFSKFEHNSVQLWDGEKVWDGRFLFFYRLLILFRVSYQFRMPPACLLEHNTYYKKIIPSKSVGAKVKWLSAALRVVGSTLYGKKYLYGLVYMSINVGKRTHYIVEIPGVTTKRKKKLLHYHIHFWVRYW